MKFMALFIGLWCCINTHAQIVAVNSDAQNQALSVHHKIKYHLAAGLENKVILIDTSTFHYPNMDFYPNVCHSCKLSVTNATISQTDTVKGVKVYFIRPDTAAKQVEFTIYDKDSVFICRNSLAVYQPTLYAEMFPRLGHSFTGTKTLTGVKVDAGIESRNVVYIADPGFKVVKLTLMVTDSTEKITRFTKEYFNGTFTNAEQSEFGSHIYIGDKLWVINLQAIDKFGVVRKAKPCYRQIR